MERPRVSKNNGDKMNGVINVLKPPGMTSHDVVSFLRKTLKTKRIGHTGTLDPGAAGVLPICIGNATKLVDYLMSSTKKYRAELTLGIVTDTQDGYGKVIEKKEVHATYEDIVKVVELFKGKITQIPPMYSALKVNGKKLYELAREGIEIERQSREIKIYDIKIIKIDLENKKVFFDVECSKGTYIRTLCANIGEKLSCGGHMSFLLRIKTGSFDIENSSTLDAIAKYAETGNFEKFLIPVDEIFSHLPRATVKNDSLKWVQNGANIYLKDIIFNFDINKSHTLKLYDENNHFLAIYSIENDNNKVKLIPEKMFL